MGADIYLESISEAARRKHQPLFMRALKARDKATDDATRKKAQARVDKHYDAMHPEDGYFRDSYNLSSVFQVIDLSWWQDVGPMLDDNGYLPIPKAQELLAMVRGRPVTPQRVRAFYKKLSEEIRKHPYRGEDGQLLTKPSESIGEWELMFVEKHARFCAMLERSIALNEPLLCNI